ncbi:FG-nucleoporin nsp1 [Coemansia aciculifera]|uniref:FG-nucleoporin nsp1 n=1 Tax=Coemansia aciculifera TaxID=417176 RepID=A0ACC1M282_9FUNG|nr:FG-nucleoporin nsp1 [Coemansia aciculifera]
MTGTFSFGTGTGAGGGGAGGGGFSGFGANAGGSNLFGAKSGDESSKPEASKPSMPFSFGNSPAPAFGAAATPTPAAPSTFGASSTTGTSIFGAKPAAAAAASGASIFGSASAAAAPSTSAAAPTTSTFGGFSAFGAPSTTAAPTTTSAAAPSFGFGLGGTAAAATSKPLFGAASSAAATSAAATTAASGFQFGLTSSSTASAATTSAASAAPFGLKSDTMPASNPTAGTGFGSFKLSTAPVVSGAGSSDGKMTGTSTPAFGMSNLGLSSSGATPTIAAATTSTTTTTINATKATGDKAANATDLANAALRGKTLEEIAQMWTTELTAQTRAFHTQASTVSQWDRALVQQGQRITELYDATMAVEAEQAALDQSLADMETQQSELQFLLETYEGRVESLVRKTMTQSTGSDKGVSKSADEERGEIYLSAENLNESLDQLMSRLSTLVEDVNGISNANAASGDAEDPLAQIMQILNGHLTSLQWVESQTLELSERVNKAQSVYKDVQAKQDYFAGAFGDVTSVSAANSSRSEDAVAPDADHRPDGSQNRMPGSYAGQLFPPVISSLSTPVPSARKPPAQLLFGRPANNQVSGLRTPAPAPASPFGSSTPLRRGGY